VDLNVVRSLDEVGSGDGSIGNESEVSVDPGSDGRKDWRMDGSIVVVIETASGKRGGDWVL